MEEKCDEVHKWDAEAGSSNQQNLLSIYYVLISPIYRVLGFPEASESSLVVKNLPAPEGDTRNTSSIPGLGRFPGEGNGNPLQYLCLENPMNRGAWRALVRRVTKSWIRLSD